MNFEGGHGLWRDFAGTTTHLVFLRKRFMGHVSTNMVMWLTVYLVGLDLERKSLNAAGLSRFLDRCQIKWNKDALLWH